jgi:hypothetical protein
LPCRATLWTARPRFPKPELWLGRRTSW